MTEEEIPLPFARVRVVDEDGGQELHPNVVCVYADEALPPSLAAKTAFWVDLEQDGGVRSVRCNLVGGELNDAALETDDSLRSPNEVDDDEDDEGGGRRRRRRRKEENDDDDDSSAAVSLKDNNDDDESSSSSSEQKEEGKQEDLSSPHREQPPKTVLVLRGRFPNTTVQEHGSLVHRLDEIDARSELISSLWLSLGLNLNLLSGPSNNDNGENNNDESSSSSHPPHPLLVEQHSFALESLPPLRLPQTTAATFSATIPTEGEDTVITDQNQTNLNLSRSSLNNSDYQQFPPTLRHHNSALDLGDAKSLSGPSSPACSQTRQLSLDSPPLSAAAVAQLLQQDEEKKKKKDGGEEEEKDLIEKQEKKTKVEIDIEAEKVRGEGGRIVPPEPVLIPSPLSQHSVERTSSVGEESSNNNNSNIKAHPSSSSSKPVVALTSSPRLPRTPSRAISNRSRQVFARVKPCSNNNNNNNNNNNQLAGLINVSPSSSSPPRSSREASKKSLGGESASVAAGGGGGESSVEVGGKKGGKGVVKGSKNDKIRRKMTKLMHDLTVEMHKKMELMLEELLHEEEDEEEEEEEIDNEEQ